MSTPSAPRIAGVAGGVGTTTLATALRAYDRGREGERGVDVLACRATGHSLHHAATIVAWLADNGRPRPVLAVTSDGPGRLHNSCNARLRMMAPQLAAVVVLPYVSHWREMADPLTEAAVLSEQPAEDLPKPLRSYGRALASLTELVMRSGLLGNPGSTTATGSQPRLAQARVSSTGGVPALAPSTGGLPALAPPNRVRQTRGPRAIADHPGTTSGDLLSVPLASFAAYGGAR